MLDKITELAREYKKTQSAKILNELFVLLNRQISQKAKFLYYQQKYNINGKILKLKETGKIDLEDLVQELRLEVLQLLKKYNPKLPFSNYLFATLWNWKPSIIRQRNLREDLDVKTESDLINDQGETIGLDNFPAPEEKVESIINLDEMFTGLDKLEKKLLLLMLKFPNKNQTQLAKMLKLTQERVSQILENIRKKYKFHL